ncbi:anthrone oxygenase family protein [Gordonia sp. LSe1-13]|uniref:Anthrone oxygenase family protein n=1 Tax=Gordonia sesuvii TaxID=3116777 RepID=A0ABU7M9K6_9ACTN|nr:anthrone oxygenase family protein [Gordonia sp. LSe1-13]
MNILRDIVLVFAITTTGLVAGLLAAFAYAVMPGLQRAGAPAAVPAMQRINDAIINPVFAVIFFGAVGFGIVAVLLWWGDAMRWWLIAGVVLTLMAVVITAAVNVPLNNRLVAAGDVPAADAPTVWADFVGPWVRWNLIRAVIATAGFAVMILGLLQTRGQ